MRMLARRSYSHAKKQTTIQNKTSYHMERNEVAVFQKKDIAWKWYGAKGVKVCDEWNKSFNEFYKWAYSHGYREDLTIDRIDSNGDYSPDNCRWVTMKEQQNNRKSNRKVTYNGETKTTSQWAEQYGMSLYVLIWRLNHWDDLDAVFNKPVDKFLKKDKYIQYRR